MNKILTVLESELPMEYIDGSIQNGFQHAKLADAILKYDGIEINPKYRVVEVGGESIELTNYEFGILYLLARHPGQVFSKEQIYNQIWKEPYYRAEDNVMSLIRRIRKKIEPKITYN